MSGVFAIVPAAGLSARMGAAGGRSKLLIELTDGVSVLEVTLQSLIAASVLDGIVVATRDEVKREVEEVAERISGESIVAVMVVVGGATRQESVAKALAAVPADAEFVMVHDGARPLVPAEVVRAVVAKARETGAAIVASKMKPTLKRVDDAGIILETVDREDIWGAETPQVFRADLFREAHRVAKETAYVGTDDSDLVEHLGVAVSVVPGADRNLKLTTPGDLEIVRGLYRADRKGGAH